MASKKILVTVQVSAGAAPAEVKKVEDALGKLSTAQVKVNKATEKGRAQSGLNNAILLETGRLASDASFGFTAIANNLSQVISLFQSFARTNGGFVKSMGMLLKSLWGAGGFLIAVQLLISYGADIIAFFKGSATAAEEEAEAIKKLNEEIAENIKLRNRQLRQLRQSLGLVTKVGMDALGNLTKEISATQEDLMEIADRFDEVGISNTKLLRDEEISLENRVKIAQEMFDIFEAETRLIQLRKDETEALQRGDLDRVKTLRAQIRESQREILESNKQIEKLSEAPIGFRDKVKSASDELKIEFEELFEYLQGRAKDSDFILEKMLEGWSIRQINASLEASKALKGAGDVGIKALADLVKADDKYAKNKEDNSKAIKKLNEIERTNRNKQLKEIATNLNQAASLFGENTSGNKTMKIASAIINTYAGANEALAGPVPLNFINAAAVIAAGLANVQKIKSVKVPNERGSASTPTPTQIEAPDFNVVGAGGVSQLATTLAGVTGQPLKAFVVSKEITSAQELERNITNTASVG
tara:strand:- start:1502 stop:3094 length:1593 start_codon:yes stop_codon:yes gene_type:complete